MTRSNDYALDPLFLQSFDPPPSDSGKISHVTADAFVPSLLSNELDSIDTLLKQGGTRVPKAMRYKVLGSKDTRPDVSPIWKSKNSRQCAQCATVSNTDLLLCSRRVPHYSFGACNNAEQVPLDPLLWPRMVRLHRVRFSEWKLKVYHQPKTRVAHAQTHLQED